jgi:sirohydrochlorin ferrochelatase
LTRVRWLVVGMVAGCVVAGCGGDDGDQEAVATTVATTSTTTGASTGFQATTTTAGFSGVLIEATVTGDKVHLHGYDLSADVAPGRPAVIDFTADAPGVFEVELEQAHLRLVELQVQ